MAHEISRMAYVSATPWHGLGSALTEGQPLEIWAREAGLDWTIEETPVLFTPQSGSHPIAFQDHKVLFRSDCLTPLSVVGKRFKVVQPKEILEFYRDLTEVSGFEMETAGVLRGGRKVWALARTGQSTRLKGCDEVKAYLLLATACDGTLATTAQFTSVRVVCNNTLAVALRGAQAAVKVPHRVDFDPVAVKRRLGIATSSWASFVEQMRAMAETGISNDKAYKYLYRVFNDVTGAPSAAGKAVRWSFNAFEGSGRGADLPTAKGTVFGVLNSVTEFVDHARRAYSADYRLDSAWFGQGAAIKRRALELAEELLT
jgi:phage/plasmid-like protein (TIGR03299 family)